jgi:hypothetical protein
MLASQFLCTQDIYDTWFVNIGVMTTFINAIMPTNHLPYGEVTKTLTHCCNSQKWNFKPNSSSQTKVAQLNDNAFGHKVWLSGEYPFGCVTGYSLLLAFSDMLLDKYHIFYKLQTYGISRGPFLKNSHGIKDRAE